MATFSEAFFPSYKLHVALGSFLKCLPFQWKPEQGQFVPTSNFVHEICVRAWILVTGIYVCFQIGFLTLVEHTMIDKIVASLILNVNLATFALRFDRSEESTPINLLNRILTGDGKQGNKHFITFF